MRFTRAGQVTLAVIGGITVAAGAAAATLTVTRAPATPASRLEKTSITVGALPVVDTAGLYLAQQEGYFRQAGLNVTITPIASGPLAIPGLEAGKVDIVAGANYVSVFQAQAAGHGQFKVLADATECTTSSLQVLAAPGSHIMSPAGLAGKTIAVNALSNVQTLLTGTSLQAAGVDPRTVHYVKVPFPGMAQALAAGKVDAISAVEPFISAAEVSTGAEPIMSACTGLTASFPMSGYFSTRAWAGAHPGTARAFQAAMARGQALANASRPAVEQILPTYIKTLTPVEAAIVNLGQFPVSVNAASLERVASLMVGGGLVSPRFSAAPLLFR